MSNKIWLSFDDFYFKKLYNISLNNGFNHEERYNFKNLLAVNTLVQILFVALQNVYLKYYKIDSKYCPQLTTMREQIMGDIKQENAGDMVYY
jgi:hypothetical protein